MEQGEAQLKRKILIYLADLANTKFGLSPATVPLQIGYIKSYAISEFGKEVDIRLFRDFESLYKEVQDKKPDIIGCSWYGWNSRLTVGALAYLKYRYPDILTVVGGANAPEGPEDSLRDFKKFPYIDIIIPNEGEVPFVNLLKVYMQGGVKAIASTDIDGVYHLSDSKNDIIGRPLAALDDINIFPSPYLRGYLDKFLKTDLMPIVQSSRGCPFRCAFCVSAKNSWNKLRAFDLERVKEEVDYIEFCAKNRTIRFTDENFGILPRDLEIARFISVKRKKINYPSALRLYTHKAINQNIKEIALLLKDLIPMNISYQTLTDSVLKNINRINIGQEQYRQSVNWAHKNNLNVTTEIIFGLPGETYESFMKTISQLVEMRLDSVAIGTLIMLKETEVSRPEIMNKYGYKVLYSVAERGYTKSGDFQNLEIDCWVVESKYFSFEEYIKINLFTIIYDLFMFSGYFKEVVYMWENRGVKIADVVSELLKKSGEYPFFLSQIQRQEKCLKDNLFKTEEEVIMAFGKKFSGNSDSGQYIGFVVPFILSKIIKGEMINPENQERMIDEVLKASLRVFDAAGKGSREEFLEEMRFAKGLVKTVIIPFCQVPEEEVTLTSRYDLIAWRNNDYRGGISEFKLSVPFEYRFVIHSLSEYVNFINSNSGKPYYMQSEFFFRSFRSNNVRRFIA